MSLFRKIYSFISSGVKNLKSFSTKRFTKDNSFFVNGIFSLLKYNSFFNLFQIRFSLNFLRFGFVCSQRSSFLHLSIVSINSFILNGFIK